MINIRNTTIEKEIGRKDYISQDAPKHTLSPACNHSRSNRASIVTIYLIIYNM